MRSCLVALALFPLPALSACASSGGVGVVSSDVLRANVEVSAMAPLVIADEAGWTAFAADLVQAKATGITTISVDVWWGDVERAGDEQFDWSWVDRASRTILDAGLRWRPVLAFHRCGGNVGDTCDVAIPAWVFAQHPGIDLGYVSAQGHSTNEVLSVWATPLVLDQYRQFTSAFVRHFAPVAAQTSGIAVGLGSASELRYPSYNSHDIDAGYPGPGVLQAYSALASTSFRDAMLAKYGSLAAVATAWGIPVTEIVPPSTEDAYTDDARGHDFFDWYRGSLLAHGEQVLGAVADVVATSPFAGRRLSARIPGVHWRAADTRHAELSAGLLATSERTTWSSDASGHGYAPFVSMIARLRARADHPDIALEYTCLEKPDGEGGPAVGSLAESLVFWVANAAYAQQVPLGGENALSGALSSDDALHHIDNALTWSHYDSLTLLRVHDVVTSPSATAWVHTWTARP